MYGTVLRVDEKRGVGKIEPLGGGDPIEFELKNVVAGFRPKSGDKVEYRELPLERETRIVDIEPWRRD